MNSMFDPHVAFDPKVIDNDKDGMNNYFVEVPREFSIAVSVRSSGGGSYFEILNPGSYWIVVDETEVEKFKIDISSVLAHELGHIVAMFARKPASCKSFLPWSELIDREKEAWACADEIYEKAKHLALATYKNPGVTHFNFTDFEIKNKELTSEKV